MLMIPELGVQTGESLELSLIKESQVNERPRLKNQGRWLLRLTFDLSIGIETYMHACRQAGMQTGNYCERA